MDKPGSAPRLKRTLGLWSLILYGVIVIQPTAPMSVYGVLSERGRGHVVVTIILAMIAMLFTAVSYGRMARVYPSAGSAFTYVGQELNPALGYVTGWSMVMDYMLNPIICIVWCSKAAANFTPGLPQPAWIIFFFLLFTLPVGLGFIALGRPKLKTPVLGTRSRKTTGTTGTAGSDSQMLVHVNFSLVSVYILNLQVPRGMAT